MAFSLNRRTQVWTDFEDASAGRLAFAAAEMLCHLELVLVGFEIAAAGSEIGLAGYFVDDPEIVVADCLGVAAAVEVGYYYCLVLLLSRNWSQFQEFGPSCTHAVGSWDKSSSAKVSRTFQIE